MANYSLEMSSAVSTGWEYAKKYGLLIAVIYFVVSMLTGGLQHMSGGLNMSDSQALGEAIGKSDWQSVAAILETSNNSFASHFGTCFACLINVLVSVGLYNMALGLMNGRYSEVTFDAFKLPLAVYAKMFVVDLIVSIICIVSACFCIIPVFFVAPRLILAPVYQVDNPEAGIIESISAAWKMTSGNTFSMLGLGVIMFGVACLGVLCCCIGVYFAEAIELLTLVAAYYQLKGNLQ
jgi:hypothetical protein